jgi:hypothetical protein
VRACCREEGLTRRWFRFASAVLFGVCLGLATGYFAVLVRAGANSALLDSPVGHGFRRAYTDMGKLRALEIVAADCKGSGDVSSTMTKQAEVIQSLRMDLSGAAIIDVAEARLASRAAVAAEAAKDAKLQSEQETRAHKLLESAGWHDSSAVRMRQITLLLDREQCGHTNEEGAR